MKFSGFIGPTYTLSSVNVDCQACMNLYPILNEMGKGKADEIAYLMGTPGLQLISEVGTGPIRLIHYDDTKSDPENPTTRVFVASGNEMYKFSKVDGVWTEALLGTLNTSVGVIKAASNKVDLGQTVFVDGSKAYLFKKTISTEEFGDYESFDLVSPENPTHVIFLDGYFVSCNGSGQFFVSALNGLNFSALSFASAEGDPDEVEALISNRRDLWLAGKKSMELWINTGNADFPFDRASGGFIEKGIAAKHSLAKIDNMVFWLGRDAGGQGIVYAGQGLTPERISTHAIEYAISTYADISTATAFTYQSGGHAFYFLNFDEASWVFDLSSKLWHQRSFTDDGVISRHRANYHAFLPEYGIHMIGDYANNKIYQFNEEYYFDDTNPITALRASPHVSKDEKQMTCHAFQLLLESGVGLDGTGQGTDPQIMMQFSKDGGHTWSDEDWTGMGKIGEKRARAIWRRLGRFRDLVIRVKITDPVKRVLIGADLDLELGNS